MHNEQLQLPLDDLEEAERPVITTLPNAVVDGWSVNQLYVVGTEGERRKVVVLSLQFSDSTGMVGQQSFLLSDRVSKAIRRDLKRPEPLTTLSEEES